MSKMEYKYEDTLKAWLEQIGQEFMDADCYNVIIDDISADSYDGFIAFTNGGLALTCHDNAYFAECRGFSKIENEYLSGHLERANKDAIDDFIQENDKLRALNEEPGFDILKHFQQLEDDYNEFKRIQPTFEGFPMMPEFNETPGNKLREEMHNYISDHIQEGFDFYYKIRVQYYKADNPRNDSGEDEIFFMFLINTDYTYGRDKHDNLLYERNVLVRDLAPKVLEAIHDDIWELFT